MTPRKYVFAAFAVLSFLACARAEEEEQSPAVVTGTPKNFDSLVTDGLSIGCFALLCVCVRVCCGWSVT